MNVIRYKGIAIYHITVDVSSIGAIWTLARILKASVKVTLKFGKSLIKSISANVIIGSLNIWHNRYKMHCNLNSNDPSNTELDLSLRSAPPVNGEATFSDYD